MGINVVETVDDQVRVNTVLISVSDKGELDAFIPRLIRIRPKVHLYSTGGTFKKLKSIIGDASADRLSTVSEYTGQPETQGGLVKTLDFKIYLGLLTETYNADHRSDLARTKSIAIDLVVVNLYPFRETVAQAGVTVEQARGNIDIGGPCMIRAAAKNFIRVAAVVDPKDYGGILDEMAALDGCISLDTRFRLAQKAFAHTAAYDQAIADFIQSKQPSDARAAYPRIR